MRSPKIILLTTAVATLLFAALLVRVADITDTATDTPTTPAASAATDRAALADAEATSRPRVPTSGDYLSVTLNPDDVENFTLQSTRNGQEFALLAPNRITVLYYGFTSCPDVCPTTLHDLRVALEALGNPPPSEIQVAMVTVDPARDTPEQLQAYVERFSEDFIGLYGDDDALQTAYDAFDITFERVALPGSAMEYTIDHTADVFLLAPGLQRVQRFYHSASSSNFAHDLQLMLDEYAFELQANGHIPAAELAPDFTLQSTTGDTFTLSDQQRITVLYYGFTSCPDVCPTTLHEINRALQLLDTDTRAQIQVAMVTVDPERDTPRVLGDYMQRFNADFFGLYGERPAIEAAQAAFNVSAFKREFAESALTYTYDHTADVFVVAPGGAYRLRIPYGTPRTAIAADLQRLVAALG